jgi:hypothetical protein
MTDRQGRPGQQITVAVRRGPESKSARIALADGVEQAIELFRLSYSRAVAARRSRADSVAAREADA